LLSGHPPPFPGRERPGELSGAARARSCSTAARTVAERGFGLVTVPQNLVPPLAWGTHLFAADDPVGQRGQAGGVGVEPGGAHVRTRPGAMFSAAVRDVVPARSDGRWQ
jgi:hypothetical protein